MVEPQAPVTRPDPKGRVALAGFVCGLGVLTATALAGGAIYERVPGTSSGEGALLAMATFPLAVRGMVLSVRGRTSSSQRGLAIVGLFCCFMYFFLVVLEGVAPYLLGQTCATQVDGCF